MKDLASRLRKHAEEVLDPGYPYYGTPEMVREAASEIERLRQERNHWMAAARAFDDHLATMRVIMMEHPSVRFSEPRY